MKPDGTLELDDILDLRAYERVREEFRAAIIAKKKRRRVSVGPIITAVFECVDTVRFQIQEMARAEKIFTDEGIQTELDIYNQLLPSPGELSATVFIELTTDADLRTWLPRLVGIERQLYFDVMSDDGLRRVMSVPEAQHEAALTREHTTSAVHYVRFPFPPDLATLSGSTVTLGSAHPAYLESSVLSAATVEELEGDLAGLTAAIPLN